MSKCILRTRRSYEKAMNDLNFLEGIVLGMLNDNNTLPYNEFMDMIHMFKNLSGILDECIMNCEMNGEMKEGE